MMQVYSSCLFLQFSFSLQVLPHLRPIRSYRKKDLVPDSMLVFKLTAHAPYNALMPALLSRKCVKIISKLNEGNNLELKLSYSLIMYKENIKKIMFNECVEIR